MAAKTARTEIRHLCHKPLRKGTWLSGIGLLKGDREVQTDREPSGRGSVRRPGTYAKHLQMCPRTLNALSRPVPFLSTIKHSRPRQESKESPVLVIVLVLKIFVFVSRWKRNSSRFPLVAVAVPQLPPNAAAAVGVILRFTITSMRMNSVRFFEPMPFEMKMSSNECNCTMARLPQSSLPPLLEGSFSSSFTLRPYDQPSA